jgi:hypothetical protein
MQRAVRGVLAAVLVGASAELVNMDVVGWAVAPAAGDRATGDEFAPAVLVPAQFLETTQTATARQLQSHASWSAAQQACLPDPDCFGLLPETNRTAWTELTTTGATAAQAVTGRWQRRCASAAGYPCQPTVLSFAFRSVLTARALVVHTHGVTVQGNKTLPAGTTYVQWTVQPAHAHAWLSVPYAKVIQPVPYPRHPDLAIEVAGGAYGLLAVAIAVAFWRQGVHL